MKKQFRFYLFSLVCMLFCCLDQPASALYELPTVCDSNNIIPDIGSDVFSDARQGGCAPTFTWLETNPCEVQFTGPSCDPCALTGGAMNVTWNFGDGSPMYTGVDPFHVFPPGGVWYVCMTIQCVDADGNVASTSDICQFIYTTCCSEPSFSWTEINPCEVQFFGPDCNPCGLYNTEVVWDFGDGSGTVTGADPFHVFAGPGPFNVCMTVNCVYDDGSVTVYTWTTCQVVATSCCNNPNFSWVETNPCEVYFTGPDCDPCAPLGVMDIYWDFGDGSPVAFGANPTHVYGPGGPWNVCMTVMCINFDGTSGATYTQCNTVTTNCCPQPDFTWTETSPCLVQFTGPSCDPCVGTGMVTNVFWNFGDGNTGVGPNPVNDYSASGPGSYNVCMTVECLDPAIGIPTFTYTTCEVITVVCGSGCTPCDPFFLISSDPNCCFEFIPMVCVSLPNYACESWDFGDGTVISGGAFIYHCYAFPGTYTVCHTTCCIDAAGNVVTSTHCRDVTCTCTPDATFSYTVSGCCADFINTGFDPTLPYASCALWEFGDGTTASGIGAVNHCFPGNGVYTVCFTNCCMDNGVLITSTWCTDVTITDCCGCGPLATSFTVNNATDCCLELVADVPDPTVPTLPCVYWDFGDGSAPLFGTYVANHCFPGPGTYHVCLTDCCVNADGTYTSTVTCQDVVVTGSCCCPNADFTWVFDSSCTVQFEGPNCASYSVVTWTFGDGGTYTGINPNYTYTAPGLYNVCMTVTCVPTGGTASSTTICHDIYVPCCAAGCDTDATFDYEIVCNDVNFTGIDNGLPSGCWNWDFGDGTGGTGTVISHSYPGPGTYNVCMTVCCFDPVVGWYSTTNCQTITIDPCCDLLADFTWASNCLTVDFTGIDLGLPSGCWHWNFGDGTPTVAGTTVSHTYATGGIYHVCLTVCCDDPVNQVTLVQTYCYDVVVQCCDLLADFNWTGSFPTLTFNAFDLGDPSFCWHWNFGDGSPVGTGMTVTHTYTTPGTYTVCLEVCCDDVVNQISYVDYICHTITVMAAAPVCEVFPSFNAVTTQVNAIGHIYEFVNTTSAGSATEGTMSYLWSFGDGTYSDLEHPVHQYNIPGVYEVCLTTTVVNGSNTCSDTSCSDVRALCLGDLDNNGVVNIGDLLGFLGLIGSCN